MALFFDQAWFDAQLTRMGTSRADIALLLSLSAVQVEELWKDQRELSARDVALLARFLNVSPLTVAERAGVSTPVPADETSAGPAVQALEQRIDQLEKQVRALALEIDRLRASEPRR